MHNILHFIGIRYLHMKYIQAQNNLEDLKFCGLHLKGQGYLVQEKLELK